MCCYRCCSGLGDVAGLLTKSSDLNHHRDVNNAKIEHILEEIEHAQHHIELFVESLRHWLFACRLQAEPFDSYTEQIITVKSFNLLKLVSYLSSLYYSTLL